MRKLLFALPILFVAGCSGVQVDTAAVTDCMVQCLDENIQITLPSGEVITVKPSDYKEAVWNSEKQTLELKGYKASSVKVGAK